MPQLHYSIQIEQDPLTVHNVLVDKEAYGTWTYSFSKQSDFIGDWSEGSQIMFTFVEPSQLKWGMVATVDVKTGEKTVFQYLIKPITRMKQALRER